jgi:hypothetical protein
MSSDQAFELGQSIIYGCPWHGRIESGVLQVGGGVSKFGFVGGVRGVLRLQVPGVPAITRSPAQATADAQARRQWRTDAALTLVNNSAEMYLYGAKSLPAQTLYAVAPGQCWAVSLPASPQPNAARTALTSPAQVRNISKLGFSFPENALPVSVALEGYASAPEANPAFALLAWDMLPDGSRAILGLGSISSRFGNAAPQAAAGFAELRSAGAGTEQSPLALTLALLSIGNSVAEESSEDNLSTWSGVWGWRFDVAQEPFTVPGRTCPSIRETYRESNFFLDPDGTPSVNTPAVSITTGTRSASVTDFVLGYWYSPEGERVAITMDVSYDLEASFNASGVGVGAPPRVLEIEQAANQGGACLPTTTVVVVEAGSYEWAWEAAQQTTETLGVVLKVGGVEIDRHEAIYEHSWVQAYSGQGSVGVNNGPGVQSGTLTTSSQLLIDGELLDSLSEQMPTGAGLVSQIGPVTRIDDLNRFESGPPSQWLTTLPANGIRLGEGYRHVWRCHVHWWSNHLVCLREDTRSLPALRINERYGYTAHPEGITTARITSFAPNALAHAPPLYGARNVLTGAIELGRLAPFSFV